MKLTEILDFLLLIILSIFCLWRFRNFLRNQKISIQCRVLSSQSRHVNTDVAKCIGNPILKKMCHFLHGNLFFEPLDDQNDSKFGQYLQILDNDIHAIYQGIFEIFIFGRFLGGRSLILGPRGVKRPKIRLKILQKMKISKIPFIAPQIVCI